MKSPSDIHRDDIHILQRALLGNRTSRSPQHGDTESPNLQPRKRQSVLTEKDQNVLLTTVPENELGGKCFDSSFFWPSRLDFISEGENHQRQQNVGRTFPDHDSSQEKNQDIVGAGVQARIPQTGNGSRKSTEISDTSDWVASIDVHEEQDADNISTTPSRPTSTSGYSLRSCSSTDSPMPVLSQHRLSMYAHAGMASMRTEGNSTPSSCTPNSGIIASGYLCPPVAEYEDVSDAVPPGSPADKSTPDRQSHEKRVPEDLNSASTEVSIPSEEASGQRASAQVLCMSICQEQDQSDADSSGVYDGDLRTLDDQPDDLVASKWLAEWQIPSSTISAYTNAGVVELYSWQVDCIESTGVLEDRKNLVYSAPTGAGKTLVAEVAAIRRLVQDRKRVLFVVPFVSIVMEKVEYFRKLLEEEAVTVQGYCTGSLGTSTKSANPELSVCTIEKANGIINRVLQEQRLSEIGLVVVDEIHMLSDCSRGYLLEIMLAKLLFKARSAIQLVLLSATAPNLAELALWARGAVFASEFRAVPLSEHLVVARQVSLPDGTLLRTLPPPAAGSDPEGVAALCGETVREGGSVLVFCASQRAAQSCALALAKQLPLSAPAPLPSSLEASQRRSRLLHSLAETPAGLDPVLAQTVPRGVGFHHAGLTAEERRCLEGAYDAGVLPVLAATSTLAAGVNLPAHRVLFRSPYVGPALLDVGRYRQMSGRAGRAGRELSGESFVLCEAKDRAAVQRVMQAPTQPVQSCLAAGAELSGAGMRRAVLEAVENGIAGSEEEVRGFLGCTLCSAAQGQARLEEAAGEASRWLEGAGMLRRGGEGRLWATQLGKAVVGSSLGPCEALAVYGDLARAREGMGLDDELHVIFVSTPVTTMAVPWGRFFDLFQQLGERCRRIAALLGVRESFLLRARARRPEAATGGGREAGEERGREVGVHARFFAAMMLRELLLETRLQATRPPLPASPAAPPPPLTEALGCAGRCEQVPCAAGRGAAAADAGRGLRRDGGRLLREAQLVRAQPAPGGGGMQGEADGRGRWPLEALCGQFQQRLSAEAPPELLPLTRLPGMRTPWARALHLAGLTSPRRLASASPPLVAEILAAAMPFAAETLGQEQGWALRQAEALVRGACRVVARESQGGGAGEEGEAGVGAGRGRWREVRGSAEVEGARREWARAQVLGVCCRVEEGRAVGVAVSAGAGRTRYMEVDGECRELLGELLGDVERVVVMGDAKGQEQALWRAGLEVRARVEDPLLAAGLLPTTQAAASLVGLAEAWGLEVEGADGGGEESGMEESSREAEAGAAVREVVAVRLRASGLERYYQEVEMPVARALAKMEAAGVGVSRAALEVAERQLREGQARVEEEVAGLAGRRVELGSAAAVAGLLYEDLRIPLPVAGASSAWRARNLPRLCAPAALRELAERHRAPALILLHRRLSFLRSNTLRPLKAALARAQAGGRGAEGERVYATQQLRGSETGRIAVKAPNVQCIPKPIRLPQPHAAAQREGEGAEGGGEVVAMRSCVVAGAGRVLLCGDYRQLELRVIAHLSGDEALRRALTSGQDVFREMAAGWGSGGAGEVTVAARDQAKRVCYGLMYGMGAASMAGELGVCPSEAERLMKTFRSSYAGVDSLIRSTIERARAEGFVSTLKGRRRWLPDLLNPNTSKRTAAERQAFNTLIQGSAADVLRAALVSVTRALPAEDGAVVMQVHDELMLEVAEASLPQAARMLKVCMESAVQLQVPLEVKLQFGTCWSSMEEMD